MFAVGDISTESRIAIVVGLTTLLVIGVVKAIPIIRESELEDKILFGGLALLLAGVILVPIVQSARPLWEALF